MIEEVKELVGVEMNVADADDIVIKRWVYGRMGGDLITSEIEGECHRIGVWRKARPLPEPWEIAPEGGRFVTEGEKRKYGKKGVPYKCISKDNRRWCAIWTPSTDNLWHDSYYYAVPIDYQFKPEVVEVAVSDLIASYEKKTGLKVKVAQ